MYNGLKQRGMSRIEVYRQEAKEEKSIREKKRWIPRAVKKKKEKVMRPVR